MTRINTVDVKDLTDQHLMAEYRELPMVNASLTKTLASKGGLQLSKISEQYTLNRGHVTFFYNKGGWLYDRYMSLIQELKNRNYNIDPESRVVKWQHFKDNDLFNSWSPNREAHATNVERLLERVAMKVDWYRYYSKPLEGYIELMKEKYGVR